jgi:hypothetical protein
MLQLKKVAPWSTAVFIAANACSSEVCVGLQVRFIAPACEEVGSAPGSSTRREKTQTIADGANLDLSDPAGRDCWHCYRWRDGGKMRRGERERSPPIATSDLCRSGGGGMSAPCSKWFDAG